MISDVVVGFRRCSDPFGCIRMRSDAIGCIWVHSDALGHFWKICFFFDDFENFWMFLTLGAYFYGHFYV